MAGIDIRELKRTLRADCKAFRRGLKLSDKAVKDEQIFQKLIALPEYQNARQLLTYVSTPIEVATFRLIDYSLKQGKTVAVPRCAEGGAQGVIAMDFFQITSLRDLEVASFSVLEPKPELCRRMTGFDSSSVCIVPGLAFDMHGYRLGYGKGYYDRFLGRYPGVTVGICYNGCIKSDLPHGRFDRTVDLLITEKFMKRLPPLPKKEKAPVSGAFSRTFVHVKNR